jgi:hypothetical protein
MTGKKDKRARSAFEKMRWAEQVGKPTMIDLRIGWVYTGQKVFNPQHYSVSEEAIMRDPPQ